MTLCSNDLLSDILKREKTAAADPPRAKKSEPFSTPAQAMPTSAADLVVKKSKYVRK